MCKANENMISKVAELMELRKMIEELQTEAEALTDNIKSFMGDEETMFCGPWKITYRETIVKQKHLRLVIIGSITVDCRNSDMDPMSEAFLQMASIFNQTRVVND